MSGSQTPKFCVIELGYHDKLLCNPNHLVIDPRKIWYSFYYKKHYAHDNWIVQKNLHLVQSAQSSRKCTKTYYAFCYYNETIYNHHEIILYVKQFSMWQPEHKVPQLLSTESLTLLFVQINTFRIYQNCYQGRN